MEGMPWLGVKFALFWDPPRVLAPVSQSDGECPVKRVLREEHGQTATEYMLLIGVVVIAVVAGAYTFVPTFNNGVRELAYDVAEGLRTHKLGGVGMDSMSGSGNDDGGSLSGPGIVASDSMSGSSLDNNPPLAKDVSCSAGSGCVDTISEGDGSDASDLGDIFK